MKFVVNFVTVLLVASNMGLAQAPKPTSVEFSYYADRFHETVFDIGNEKVVHHWEHLRSEWKEDITVSSPNLAARRFPTEDGLTKGFPDTYEIHRKGEWVQIVPPGVSTTVQERYKEYLKIARNLSAGHWPSVPRSQ